MEFLNSLERQEFLAEVVTGSFNSKKDAKKINTEIIVDENHQLSEDAKFGYELSKNPIAWKKYFEN